MSQRKKGKDANKTMQRSACAKHLEFARLKESGKKWCFPLHVDKERVQFPVSSLPRAKHCEVYRSFLEEKDTGDGGSKETSSRTNKTSLLGKITTPDIERRIVKAEEGTLACRCKQQDAAVKRYALYRGMLNQ